MHFYEKYIKYKNKYLALKGGLIYEIHLNEPWFTLTKNCIKNVEGRLNKGIFSRFKINDQIIFFNFDKATRRRNQLKVTIASLKKYKSFQEMLEAEGLHKVLPDPEIKNISEGVEVYRKWYSPELEKEFGVLAIRLEKC